MQKTEILGIPFDNVTKSEAISLAKSYLENGKKAVIVTPNAEIVKACGDDMEVRRAVVSADIILPDGEGVIWAGKKLGTPLKEKVAGVEFGAELCALAAEKNYSIYFLGGKPGVAEKAAKELQKKNPGLSVIGFRDGYFKKSGEESDLVIKIINESGADILFVCLGAPAQEKWVYENREKLKRPHIIACLGGSLDIYSGNAKRAPALFIKLRLEWFWRLIKEPTRIGRMMNIPRFMRSVLKYRKSLKAHH